MRRWRAIWRMNRTSDAAQRPGMRLRNRLRANGLGLRCPPVASLPLAKKGGFKSATFCLHWSLTSIGHLAERGYGVQLISRSCMACECREVPHEILTIFSFTGSLHVRGELFAPAGFSRNRNWRRLWLRRLWLRRLCLRLRAGVHLRLL